MRITSRKLINRSFTGLGVTSILLLAASLLVVLTPIVVRGLGAFVFRGTVEHRQVQSELFDHGNATAVEAEAASARQARQPVYDMIAAFEKDLDDQGFAAKRKYADSLKDLKDSLRVLLGPAPGEAHPVMPREQYGQTRWDRARFKLHQVLYVETYDYSNPNEMGKKVHVPRVNDFKGTAVEPLFAYVETNLDKMLLPRWTFYWGFLTDESKDAHFFGGIWPELLGTFYLTVGAILFAVPMGLISATPASVSSGAVVRSRTVWAA